MAISSHCNMTALDIIKKTSFYFGHDRNSSRLSFGEAFALAGWYLPGRTVIITNLDIYFDPSLAELRRDRFLSHTTSYFLSRYEPNGAALSLGTQCKMGNYLGSHDSFIIVPPIPSHLVKETMDLRLGTPGVENRLIHEFRRAGLCVYNPCLSIRSWHLHGSAVRTLGLPLANTMGRNDVAHPRKLAKKNKDLME